MKLRKCMCVAALAGLFVLTNTFPAAAEGNQDSKTVNSAEIVPAMAGFQIDLSGFIEGSYDQMDYITISGTRHQILMIGISGVHPDIFFWKFFLDPENQSQNIWLVLELKGLATQNGQAFIIRFGKLV